MIIRGTTINTCLLRELFFLLASDTHGIIIETQEVNQGHPASVHQVFIFIVAVEGISRVADLRAYPRNSITFFDSDF